MDPLTITASVLSITTRCIHIAKDLSDLREKFKDAQMMISAICSESTVISASLAHIQTIVLSNPDALTTQLQFRPELEGAFDTALTGCMMVFSVLQDEVQSLTSSSKSASKDIGWSIKAKYLWKEESMKDLLQQLRGQQTALTLLIQALQMEKLSDIRQLLQNNNTVLEQVVRRTLTLRRTHPRVRVPQSIKAPQSIFDAGTDDAESILNVGRMSMDTSTEFEFDHLIMRSKVYRRALSQTEDDGDQSERHSDAISDGETVSYAATEPPALSKQSTAVGSSENDLKELQQKYTDLRERHEQLNDEHQKLKQSFSEQRIQLEELKSRTIGSPLVDLADERGELGAIRNANHTPCKARLNASLKERAMTTGSLQRKNARSSKYFPQKDPGREERQISTSPVEEQTEISLPKLQASNRSLSNPVVTITHRGNNGPEPRSPSFSTDAQTEAGSPTDQPLSRSLSGTILVTRKPAPSAPDPTSPYKYLVSDVTFHRHTSAARLSIGFTVSRVTHPTYTLDFLGVDLRSPWPRRFKDVSFLSPHQQDELECLFCALAGYEAFLGIADCQHVLERFGLGAREKRQVYGLLGGWLMDRTSDCYWNFEEFALVAYILKRAEMGNGVFKLPSSIPDNIAARVWADS
ncbi:hypothetical protein W97_02723 [Coniosporium apollinis CBS 100218]|uniref:Fungal N-terminal domain-containing protein n=1 Tax=Coniosporium apollinis (strain CBS 100218) TaxID=1168221 RepID=R7YNJ8_CONA1|nr:uncharacterized protein W97_02723 [Coniosporium apollinis CBS 100218]EON63495.1 hypothetical protein W97_02723 [Coniosporium apollinis CBS 100218]